MKQNAIERFEKLFSTREKVVPVDFWTDACSKLIERPDGTKEFDDLIIKQMERLKEGHSPEQAAKYINKTINILYHQRHPAKHMQMLAAIL